MNYFYFLHFYKIIKYYFIKNHLSLSLHSPITHSSPSYKPLKLNIVVIIYIPSPVFAEHATIFHFLSSISSRFNSSAISSGDRARPKSYLFAYTSKGISLSVSSYSMY